MVDNKPDISPLHLSKHRDRQHHVNLLLIQDQNLNTHYLYVTDLSRLVAGRTKHDPKTHVCEFCLHCFARQEALDRHRPECSLHPAQTITYPQKPWEKEVKFRAFEKQETLPFCIYLDFESFLKPCVDERPTQTKDQNIHIPSGVCCYRTSKYPEYATPPFLYSGERVLERLFEHLEDEERQISEILSQNNAMLPLSREERCAHERARHCALCDKSFTEKNPKVHHHDHVNSKYIGPYCNDCNLQLKTRRSQSALNHAISDSFFIPVIAHNMKSYDLHHILKFMSKDMLQTADGKTKQIEIIPSNSEKFIAMQIGGLRFIDSLQFLPASLENLVSNLSKDGYEKFIHTKKHLPDTELVYTKGVYPYEYMTDITKFGETNLPQKKHFYSKLNNEDITDADYKHAKAVWSFFNCTTIQDYHDIYLKTDVLLLADIFENFRSMAMATHHLDPAHYYTLPGFSWDACLLKTKITLELFDNPEMQLFVENAMRGGISTITHRYAKANNPLLNDYDSSLPTSYLMYLDCNNLYGDAMRKPLPTGGFRFLPEAEIENFDTDSLDSEGEKGYILEVDLEYPPELHDQHNDYPLAAEQMTVSEEMLSPYCTSFNKKTHKMFKISPQPQQQDEIHPPLQKSTALQETWTETDSHPPSFGIHPISVDGTLHRLQHLHASPSQDRF
jgi:hypothetical protein